MNPCDHHDIEQNTVDEDRQAYHWGNDHSGRELHEEDEERADDTTENGQWYQIQELRVALSDETAIAAKCFGEYELDANADEEENRHNQRQDQSPDERGAYRK